VTDVPTRREAILVLTRQRAEVLALLERLPARARTRPGLGGGDWSPKDLLGHLESWERHALDALEAWARDEPAPVDVALRRDGLTAVNAREVQRRARRPYGRVASEAAATHAALLEAIRSMPRARWVAPATSRGRAALGVRLGRLLVGAGPFGHDRAHLRDLAAFVEDHAGRRPIR
jgi:hypothetical protein